MEEGSGLRGGVFSNLSPGILGLEMPTHQQQQGHQMMGFARPEQRGSDDEEADGKRKGSPWHRMKWSDGMVRLLIMAVYYIGDECGSEGNDGLGKKKGGGLTQKKGKWKSVSKAMMEKGFYVSPQQCEDKFNDLNKRYKRVNEILGKGTACRVVENQRLLDQMDHLSGKSKEEVRKLLNSKHLFFREMCAYHNSCGGGGGDQSPAPENINSHVNHQSEEEEEGEECWDEEEECWEDEEEECWEVEGRKKGRGGEETTSFEKLKATVGEVMEDGGRSGREKREWMRMRMVRVEEERLGQEMEAYEIEKERVKWVKYSGKKEREMERKRLRNERGKLECDRMVLLLKRKEIEMMMMTKIRPGL